MPKTLLGIIYIIREMDFTKNHKRNREIRILSVVANFYLHLDTNISKLKSLFKVHNNPKALCKDIRVCYPKEFRYMGPILYLGDISAPRVFEPRSHVTNPKLLKSIAINLYPAIFLYVLIIMIWKRLGTDPKTSLILPSPLSSHFFFLEPKKSESIFYFSTIKHLFSSHFYDRGRHLFQRTLLRHQRVNINIYLLSFVNFVKYP